MADNSGNLRKNVIRRGVNTFTTWPYIVPVCQNPLRDAGNDMPTIPSTMPASMPIMPPTPPRTGSASTHGNAPPTLPTRNPCSRDNGPIAPPMQRRSRRSSGSVTRAVIRRSCGCSRCTPSTASRLGNGWRYGPHRMGGATSAALASDRRPPPRRPGGASPAACLPYGQHGPAVRAHGPGFCATRPSGTGPGISVGTIPCASARLMISSR